MNKAQVDFLVKHSLLEWLARIMRGRRRRDPKVLWRSHVYHLADIEAIVVIYLLLLLLPVWLHEYRHAGPWHW